MFGKLLGNMSTKAGPPQWCASAVLIGSVSDAIFQTGLDQSEIPRSSSAAKTRRCMVIGHVFYLRSNSAPRTTVFRFPLIFPNKRVRRKVGEVIFCSSNSKKSSAIPDLPGIKKERKKDKENWEKEYMRDQKSRQKMYS